MNSNTPYIASITREQFMFYEMRTTAQLMMEGKSDKEIIQEIIDDNLFQYPTEKSNKRMAMCCLKRLKLLEDKQLVNLIANGSSTTAKQVCLYAMMNQYRLVYEFMVTVIAEKYRLKDNSFAKSDVSVFFTRLQEQNDTVASWSVSTIAKIQSVLLKLLVDNGYLESNRSEVLDNVLINFDLKNILLEKKDYAALTAFNCFEGEEE